MMMMKLVAFLFIVVQVRNGQCRNVSLVEWHAPFFSGGGYCSEATTLAVALSKEKKISLRIVQHGDGYSHNYVSGLDEKTAEEIFELSRRRKIKPADLVVCHSEPGAWHVLDGPSWPSSPCPNLRTLKKKTIRIGRTMFETDRIPDGWPQRLLAMDEVWVPTEFQASIFKDHNVHNVFVLGEAVDTTLFSPLALSSSSDNTSTPKKKDHNFLALSVFKWEPRKGWDLLLRAWHETFSSEECKANPSPPTLLLLTNAFHSSTDFEEKLDAFARDPNGLNETRLGLRALCPLQIISHVSQSELVALYRRADVLVMPTRGEGWGRPHVEAMACGTPIIATNWSGPTAYLTSENGYPLRIHPDLAFVGGDGPFKDHRWAEPDVNHLTRLLRRAHDFPDERRAKGARARQDMTKYFSPEILAQKVRDRILYLVSSSHPSRLYEERRSAGARRGDDLRRVK